MQPFYISEGMFESLINRLGEHAQFTPMYGMLDLRLCLLRLKDGESVTIVETIPQDVYLGTSIDVNSYQSEPSVPFPYVMVTSYLEGYEPNTKLTNLEIQLANELINTGEVSLGKGKDGGLYVLRPVESSMLIFLGDVVLQRKPTKGQKTPLMLLNNKPCESIADYLKVFSLPDTYINRGRVMEWIKIITQGEEAEELKKTSKFDLNDFVSYEWKTTKKNNKYAAFLHTELGVVYGISDLVKKVPDITREQAKQLFQKFNLTPPSTIYHKIPKETTAKRPPRKKKQEKPKQNDNKLDYVISKYDLRPATRGVIMTMGTGDDMVWRTQRELLSQLREAGETITASVVKEIWATLKGRDT